MSVYTSPDAASLHVSDADEAVLLPHTQSYTDGDEILRIAKFRNCDAIIPGYGFLSENAAFAKAVTEAGLAWVGYVCRSAEKSKDTADRADDPIVPMNLRLKPLASSIQHETWPKHPMYRLSQEQPGW